MCSCSGGWEQNQGKVGVEVGSILASPPLGSVVFSYGLTSLSLRDPLCKMGSSLLLLLGSHTHPVQSSQVVKKVVPRPRSPGFKS